MEEEIWKMHKSGYYVSSFGRIKGKRVGFRKLVKQRNGYYTLLINNENKHVHRLVVETFIGEIPKGMHVNHIDGNKTNNYVSNLEVVTPSENSRHAFQLGLSVARRGEDSSSSVLKEYEILEIYDLIKAGFSNQEISEKFKIYSGHVSSLRHGHRWTELFEKHLKGNEIQSNGSSKLDLSERLNCLSDMESGMTNVELSRKYTKIDVSTFSKIRHRKTWKETWKCFDKRKLILDNPSFQA